MKIKAAVIYELAGPFVIEKVELDDPRDDEVLVRVAGRGLCNKAGKFPIDKMMTYYRLEDINQAVEDSRSGKALKAILKP